MATLTMRGLRPASAGGALVRQVRFSASRPGHHRPGRAKGGASRNFLLTNPRWSPDLRMGIRSDEWKRRALRNHFPEQWLRHTKWTPSLETYRVDPEYMWVYYQQAHRQMLYNHPEDYTHFIDEVLEHVENDPRLWVPRCLRVLSDLEERYGLSQRQYTSFIRLYGRARFLAKAEEAFRMIGEKKLPYNRENYLAMCRAYILSRHIIGEEAAVEKCRELYTTALKKGIIEPEYITLLSFEKFYDSLKRIGSELDRKQRAEEWKEKGHPLARENFDNKTLWHNIKPTARFPYEFMVFGHPMNRALWQNIDWKGVKKGQQHIYKDWYTYGYPDQIRWLEKWQKFREEKKWKEWEPSSFMQRNRPQYFPWKDATAV